MIKRLFLIILIFCNHHLFAFVISKIDDSPKNKYSDISGYWKGNGKDRSTNYTLEAFFKPDSKGNLKGYFIWNDEFGGSAKENIKGKIDLKGNIDLIGTNLINVINKFPDGGMYIQGNYSAKLSADKKSISGKWKSPDPGAFLLRKILK